MGLRFLNIGREDAISCETRPSVLRIEDRKARTLTFCDVEAVSERLLLIAYVLDED